MNVNSSPCPLPRIENSLDLDYIYMSFSYSVGCQDQGGMEVAVGNCTVHFH